MSSLDENIEYIDAYFKNQLSDAEKRQFEEKCIQDKAFAIQVASFVTSEEGIRQKILAEKKKYWSGAAGRSEGVKTIAPKQITLKKWLPYAAAACVVFVIALYFLFDSGTPHQLANKYISEHFTVLSHAMNASTDSIELGIEAYNNKDYTKALQIFKNISQSDPENVKAKRFIGLVYLTTKDYDKALQQFHELAAMKEAYNNDGLFLKAVTLLERNKAEDEKEAKLLLEQVVSENLEGSREAGKWLQKW